MLCCPQKVGKVEIEAKKLVYKAQIIPAVFYNLEAWTNLRKSDWERIERIQAKIIKGLFFGLPKNTPYWGECCTNLIYGQWSYKCNGVQKNDGLPWPGKLGRRQGSKKDSVGVRKIWSQGMLGSKCQRRRWRDRVRSKGRRSAKQIKIDLEKRSERENKQVIFGASKRRKAEEKDEIPEISGRRDIPEPCPQQSSKHGP